MRSLIPKAADLVHAQRMFDAASEVRLHAYAPYSNFLVGAAILTERGRIYVGCNVECIDYDGTHAEESALSAMVADGDRSPVLLVVLGGHMGVANSTNARPCGKCRQKLMEFSCLSNRDLRILFRDKTLGLRIVLLSHILPWSFDLKGVSADGKRSPTRRRH